MKNKKIILILSILIMLMFIIPSSFATDLDDTTLNQDSNTINIDSDNEIISNSNQAILDNDNEVISDSNVLYNNNDSILINDNSKDSNNELIKENINLKSVSSGVNVDEGISLDYDKVTLITQKSTYINGTVYCIGNYPGKPFPGALNLSYSYVGDDGNNHSANFLLGSNGVFSLDITFFPYLSPREDPYIFTIGCPDSRFLNLWDNTQMPDPVDVYVYVEQGSTLPVVNNTIYVSPNGSDLDGSGHKDYPLRTIQKAAELALQMKQNCTIVLTEGVHTVDYKVNNSNYYTLNIIGLGDVVVDFTHGSYGFELTGIVSISNITFYNAFGPRAANYAPIKMSSTGGRLLSIENCTFLNCSGNWAGAVSTYYGGSAVLKVNNTNFINCKGTNGGAIAVSNAKFAEITYCSFINCSSTYGAVGIHTTTGGLNKTKVNYCVFSGNTGTNVSDVYTIKSENLEYNFWGTNTKPDTSAVSENSTITYWVPLTIGADLSKVTTDKNILFNFDLTKYTDGNEIYDLGTLLPEIDISFSTDKGSFNPGIVKTVNGLASSTYSSTVTGTETVNIYTPGLTDTLNFDILGADSNIIYVSNSGRNSNPGTENAPYQTIEYALSQVSATRNTIYIYNGTYKEHDLEINSALVIIGESLENTIIDAENKGRIFIVSAYNKDIEIKTLTLRNAKPDFEVESYDDMYKTGKGGAIYLDEGNLLLNKTIIINSSSAAGGAVASAAGAAGSLTIIDSQFINNSLNQDAYDDGDFEIIGGGAIYADSSLTIKNSSFINNTAKTSGGNDEGGAIYIGDSASISNCSFLENAARNGGAIYIGAGNRAEVNLFENEFNLNTATTNGGAIYSGLSAITIINNNIFDENTATTNGGAIYAFGLTTTDSIINNEFRNNKAQYGGAIGSKYASIRLSNNIIEDNKASILGDEIYVDSSKLNAKLVFLDNSTKLVNHDYQTTLYASLTDDMNNPIANALINFTIDGVNIASAITDNSGLAKINYNTNETLTTYLISGSFEGTTSSYPVTLQTGLLEVTTFYWFIGDNGYFTLQDAVDASEEGDVIIGVPGSYSYREIYIGNRMEHIYKNVTIKAENLGDISLTGLGGKLFNIAAQFYGDYNHRPSLLRLENIIIENSSDEYGGAIYNDGYFEAYNCIFRNNQETNSDLQSKWHGGAIMNWRDMKIDNCTFENNSGFSGGAINTEALTGDVIITNTVFKDNFVEDTGAAIYAAGYSNTIILIENCTFINNHAGVNDEYGSGGAIFTTGNTTIINSEFRNNSATLSGGTIYSDDYFTADNITIDGSSAEFGGAFFMVQSLTYISSSTDSGYVTEEIRRTYYLSNSVIKNTYASGDGGAIYEGYYRVSTGFINNCTFINTSTSGEGGAIANYASDCTITNSKFINTSAQVGGAIFNYGVLASDGLIDEEYVATLSVYGCEFINTSSNSNGGAIMADNEYSYITLEDSTFENTKAVATGGVILNKGILNLKNNIMKNATAGSGNYIYNAYSTSRVYLRFLNAETVYYSLGEKNTYDLFVNVTDDMGNPISGMKVLFTIDDVSTLNLYDVVEGIASYSYIIPGIGDYRISGRYSGSSEGVYIPEEGILSVTMRNSTEIQVVSNETLYIGDDLVIKLVDNNGNPLENKNISISLSLNGDVTNSILTTGSDGQVNIKAPNAGTYNIKANFLGDDDYLNSSVEYDFVINKLSTDIQFSLDEKELAIKLVNASNSPIEGKSLIISIIDAKGQIAYLYETTDEDGIILLNFTNGNYLVRAEFIGDNIYLNNENSTSIEIKATKVSLDLSHNDVYVNQSFELNISLVDEDGLELNGIVVLNFNGEDQNLTVIGGKASVTMEAISFAGEYPLTLFYIGDEDYESSTAVFNIEVLNSTGNGSDIPDNGTVIPENQTLDTSYIQKLIDEANPGDTIVLGNNTYENVSDINITKNITIDGTGATIISAGDDNALFNILPVSSGVENLTIIGANIKVNNNDIVFLANAENNSNSLNIDVAEINILNNTITKANDDVVGASVNVLEVISERSSLLPTNPITVSGNTLDSGINPFKFNIISITNNSDTVVPIGGIIPEKIATLIVYENMSTIAIDPNVDGRNGEYFVVKLTDTNGNPLANKFIQIGFNANVYNRTTDENGTAKLQINLKNKGVYTFAICFLGDENYNASFVVSKITVALQKAKLTTSNKSYKASAATKTLTATFKSSRGNVISGQKVSFTVNGKTYTATTNSKGVATVKVSISKKGTYNFTAKTTATTRYAATSVSGKLTLS